MGVGGREHYTRQLSLNKLFLCWDLKNEKEPAMQRSGGRLSQVKESQSQKSSGRNELGLLKEQQWHQRNQCGVCLVSKMRRVRDYVRMHQGLGYVHHGGEL